MRTIRSLTSFVACAALVLVASSAGAVTYYSILGKLTDEPRQEHQRPAGRAIRGCGSLTVFDGPVPRARRGHAQAGREHAAAGAPHAGFRLE